MAEGGGSVSDKAQAIAKRLRDVKGGVGPGRRTSTTGSVYSNVETLKEKQARFKTNRENRKAQLTATHKYFIHYVADHVEMDNQTAEDFILDSPEQLEFMNDFIQKDGRKSLLFYFQEGESPKMESGRSMQKADKIQKIFVTDGTKEAITGQGLYFIKPKDVELNIRNCNEETEFGVLDVEGNGGLLPAIRELMGLVYLPCIKAMSNWGTLCDTPQGKKTKETFLHDLEAFVNYLDSAQTNINGAVRLSDCTTLDLSQYSNPQDYRAAANDPDVVAALEELVSGWCKQIEQV